MINSKFRKIKGPIIIGISSLLWATDGLLRYPVVSKIRPMTLVLIEHILAVCILLPWLILKQRNTFFSLNLKEWFAAAFCGIGGSAIATLFFTASFLYINPSVAVLLQKLQPVLVVCIAYIFIGEKPKKNFFFWGSIALVTAVILNFPDFDFSFIKSVKINARSKGIQYSLIAAFLWAASAVAGKTLVNNISSSLATFWRFFFGLLASIAITSLTYKAPHLSHFLEKDVIISLLYLSLIPGLFAMLLYYKGLAQTPAGVATFIELLYPILSVALNSMILHTPLETTQTIAGAILLLAVVMISL